MKIKKSIIITITILLLLLATIQPPLLVIHIFVELADGVPFEICT